MQSSGVKIRNAGEDGANMAAWLDGKASPDGEVSGNPACFPPDGSEFTAARCCKGSAGDASCWGQGYSFQRCCGAQFAAMARQRGAPPGPEDSYPEGFDQGFECVQEAGDLVFVPRSWYHAVVNLEDDTVAIAGQPSPNILGFATGSNDDEPTVHTKCLHKQSRK